MSTLTATQSTPGARPAFFPPSATTPAKRMIDVILERAREPRFRPMSWERVIVAAGIDREALELSPGERRQLGPAEDSDWR